MGNTNIISIHCNKCQKKIYKYNKESGEKFARNAIIHNKPAHKIIQGKVFVRKAN